MVRQGTMLIFSLLLVPLVAMADYTVKCKGTNSASSAPVVGECTNGVFSGVDSETGNEVQGECEAGGGFEGYDVETDEFVTGVCEASTGNEDGNDGDNGEDDQEPEGQIMTSEDSKSSIKR